MSRKSIFLLLIYFLIFLKVSSQIVINEVMISNNGFYADEDKDFPDWLEIKNISGKEINLKSWYLGDNPSILDAWKMPDKIIARDGILRIYCSGKNRYSPFMHTNFAIAGSGETLYLFTSDSVNQRLEVPFLPENMSYVRLPDGSYSYCNQPTPGNINSSSGNYNDISEKPEILPSGGIYSFPFNIAIQHHNKSSISYFTIDGKSPSENSEKYSTFFNSDKIARKSSYSYLPTNLQDISYAEYDTMRIRTRGWLPPVGDVPTIKIIRAKSYVSGEYPAFPAFETFIGNEVKKYGLPILSIAVDSLDFFSNDRGIYVYGNTYEGNYKQEGRNWERFAQISLTDTLGKILFNTNAGLRINGGGGRHAPQKAMKVYFRDEYQSDYKGYKFWGDKYNKDLTNMLLRAGGHRPDCLPRDHFASLIAEDLKMDLQNSTPVSVFLNGEFWGLHFIKQRLDGEYLEKTYNLNKGNYSILELKGRPYEGNSNDSADYIKLVSMASAPITNDSMFFDGIARKMDIENYNIYMASQIFLANGDWPNSNIRFWKGSGTNKYGDDRWRWLFFDHDGAFGGSCDNVFVTMNGLLQATRIDPGFEDYTLLFRGLLRSDKYKESFVNTFSNLLNTSFLPEVTHNKILETESQLTPIMLQQVNRWRYPSLAKTYQERKNEIPSLDAWNNTLNGLKYFAINRNGYQNRQLQEFFGLKNLIRIVLDVNNPDMGKIAVNGLKISEKTEGVTPSVYPWSGSYFPDFTQTLEAKPEKGYRFVKWLETGDTLALIRVQIFNGDRFTAIFEENPDDPTKCLMITEFMASNSNTIYDENGSAPDWIELHNPTSDTIDISDYYISDDISDLHKFRLKSEEGILKVPPGEYILLWADDDEKEGPTHLSFRLSASGEGIYLTSPGGYTICDSVTYGIQATDISMGRNYLSGEWEYIYTPTPGKSNLKSGLLNKILSPLSIRPNPTKGIVNFSRAVTGEITDLSGRKISNLQKSNLFDFGKEQPGIYILKEVTGGVFKIALFP